MKNSRRLRIVLFVVLSVVLFINNSCDSYSPQVQNNASVEKAQMMLQHGMTQEAKMVLINVIFGEMNNDQIPEAYYLLGSIAFEEDRIAVAQDTWKTLITEYPESDEAKIVKDRIDELAEIVGEFMEESIDNALALSYLRHGNFWSKGKSDRFIIDSSWITNIDAALKWYDKIINEFSGSAASRIAYENKIRALIGWEDPGRYGSSHGIRRSFSTYMPLLLETFNEFEKEHPNATTLQAFRYQIAQAYWRNKDWSNTRKWLNIVIDVAGEGDSFYKDLAERRMENIEY